MVAWIRTCLPSLWMKTWKRRHSLSPRMKEAYEWSVDLAPWDAWSMRCRKEYWLPLSPPWTFGSSWPNLLLGLVKPNFINSTTHCLAYYSRKQSLNNWPILLLFYCSLIHLFKSSHLLWPMWRVWEAHMGVDHLEWSPIGSFLACPLLLGLLIGLGLKVHVGHVLGLEHDFDLGVGPSYKPCWDHIMKYLNSVWCPIDHQTTWHNHFLLH